MKKALLLIFLITLCGSAQDISGSWSWQAENGETHMEIKLVAEGSKYTGLHCPVFQNGDRIDCVDKNDPASIIISRIAENIFEGTIRSGYSASEGKIKSIPEDEIRINGKMDYTTTSTQMFEAIGYPIKAEEIFWEMSEEVVKKYSYPGAEFFFAQDRLESYNLFSPEWSLETSKLNLKVGSKINSIAVYYPEAYSKRQEGNIVIPVGAGDYKFLLIKYNSENKITAIDQRFF